MSICLKKHNIEAYEKVKNGFEDGKKVAIIHPTGTGKMYMALKFLEENKDKKALYIAPSNSILHGVKNAIFNSEMNMTDFPNLKRMTYQKLNRLYKANEEIEADIIVLDEFHHCGGPEWGESIKKLLEQNENADVLGLSATPIRYLDGLRDMSDEIFDGNVVSEITLEEAINQGILPGADYVTAFYDFDEELEKIRKNIEDLNDEKRKVEARKTFNELHVKLDESVKNLPSILSKYMKNPNGRYIVFCKNIEDMDEKIEISDSIFNQVNPNMNIYRVASDMGLKKNEKVLSEFESDNGESLKLLFAVNMLNEGYHLKDLDGIIMMRPTLSPTIYTQQLGRALSVKNGGSSPIIIDLVNNFESYRIIEDFQEKMRHYNSNSGQRKKRNNNRIFKVYDETRGFKDIIKELNNICQVDKLRQVKKQALKYHIPVEDMNYIISMHGSMGEFIRFYKEKMVDSFNSKEITDDDIRISKKLFKQVIDLDQGIYSSNYEKLFSDIIGKYNDNKLLLFSSEKLSEILDSDLLFSDVERDLISWAYGLKDGKLKKISKAAEKKVFHRIRDKIDKFEIIRELVYDYKLGMDNGLSEEEKERVNCFIDAILSTNLIFNKLPRGGSTPSIKVLEFMKDEIEELKEIQRERLQYYFKDEKKEKFFKRYSLEDSEIEKLKLGGRLNTFLKENGMYYLGQIPDGIKKESLNMDELTERDIDSLKWSTEIIESFQKKGKKYRSLLDKYDDTRRVLLKDERTKRFTIEEMCFGISTYGDLKHGGFKTFEDILNLSSYELMDFKTGVFEEVLDRVESRKQYLDRRDDEDPER